VEFLAIMLFNKKKITRCIFHKIYAKNKQGKKSPKEPSNTRAKTNNTVYKP
jgi:hypothetical protein